jgi:uncharacterized protein (TIGR02246 family)
MFTRMMFLVILAIASIACQASGPPASAGGASPDNVATVKTAIEAANARFLDALKRADKAGVIANYADDAVLMMPNEEAWRGREGLDRGFSAFLDQVSVKDGAAITTDVMLAGDLAVETGTFAWTLQTKAGQEIKDKGKYLTVWKRQSDGSWKVLRDINNSDLPVAK